MFLIGNEKRSTKIGLSEYEKRSTKIDVLGKIGERERERETYLLLQEVARLQPRASGREKKKEWGREKKRESGSADCFRREFPLVGGYPLKIFLFFHSCVLYPRIFISRFLFPRLDFFLGTLPRRWSSSITLLRISWPAFLMYSSVA